MPAAYLRIVYIIARDDGYKMSREEFLLSPPKNLGGRTFSPKKLDSFSKRNSSKPDQVFAIVRQRNQERDFPFIWETFLFSNRKRLVKGRNVKERVRTGTAISKSNFSMSREFRHIVRVVGTDVDGSKKVVYGLGKIRGVGTSFSYAVVKAARVNPESRTGSLSETEISRIEDVIRDPGKHGIPGRLFNRRKDLETGRDMHIVGPDLVLRQKADIDFMKDIRTWKGIRHSLGLKVRGQRTRTTGRSGKAVGVKKKVLLEAAKAASRKTEEKK